MSNQRRGFAGVGVLRRTAPALALLAGLAPPVAHAQVNIDQDKTPAHIYASDCAVCHKSIRGLANGRSRTALTSYLAEHYTSSDSEAAALAAYVLSGGGGVGRPASAHDALMPAHPRDAPGMPTGREQRRSQNRPQVRERGRNQSREAPRPATPQERTPSIPASDTGPATAAAAPTAPASGLGEPPAAPATVEPGDVPSGASDHIPD
jgi:hypothetical protein